MVYALFEVPDALGDGRSVGSLIISKVFRIGRKKRQTTEIQEPHELSVMLHLPLRCLRIKNDCDQAKITILDSIVVSFAQLKQA